jgi:hypothetical protein
MKLYLQSDGCQQQSFSTTRGSIMLWGKSECIPHSKVKTLLSMNLKPTESTAESNQTRSKKIKNKNKKQKRK